MLCKGEPVRYQGELVWEHIYSDHLMIKGLLEAEGPGPFQPAEGGAVRSKLRLRQNDRGPDPGSPGMAQEAGSRRAKSMQATREPAQIEAPAVEAIAKPEPANPERATSVQRETYETPKLNIPSVFKGDGWPYKVEKKKMKR